jgi:hypothetical protein
MEKSFNERAMVVRQKGAIRRDPKKGPKVTKSQVKQMIESKLGRDLLEWNYWATSTNQSNATFSGTTYALSDIPQGDADSSRGGDALSLHHMIVNWGFYAGTGANACRIFIYQWFPTLTAGSPPAASQLLYTTGSALAPFSPYNVDTHQQFQILHDETVSVSPTEPLRLGQFKISKFPKKTIQYVGGTTNGSSKLFLVAISDDGVATYPTFSFVSKLYFIDA